MRAGWIAILMSFVACAKTNTKMCGNVTCPAGTHCGPASECVPDECGNGQPDGREECDGDESIDPTTLRCTDYGFYRGGPLTCSETCVIDTSSCSEFCGDFVVNGTERCDGVPPTGFACADFGFDIGTIGCTSSCTPAFDFCSNIGWQLVPGGASDELYAVHLLTPNAGVAVGRGGQIVAAKDGIWLPVTQTVTTDDLHGIAGNAAGVIAVGANGTILSYDGTTVAKMTSPATAHLRAISSVAAGAIAVGDGGTILRFDGTTWTAMTSPTSEDLYSVFVVNALSAYAVGANGTVLKMQGSSWSVLSITNLPAVPLYSVFVVDDAVFVAGDNTLLARIVNDSVAVVPPLPLDVPTDLAMRAIWAASASELYASGANGQLLHWNGEYLTFHDAPTNRTIYDLDGIAGRVVGVTRGGTVIAYNGTSRHVTQPGDSDLYAVHTDGTRTVAAGVDLVKLLPNGRFQVVPGIPVATSVFAVGSLVFTGSQTAGLFRYDSSLANQTNVSAAGVNGIWATETPFRIITVGETVIESTDPASNAYSQTSVTTVHGSNTLRAVWAAPDGIWYAVGDRGTAIRRETSGTWTAMSTGVTTDLLAVWGTASDDVFAVGTLGTIVHWNGTRWRPMYSGIAENLVAISGNTHSDVFVTGTSFVRLHYDGISWSRMASQGLDTPDVAVHGGTAWYVSGNRIERSDRVVGPTEVRCGDPFDNDGRDGTNCDDPDCFDDPQCLRGGACETLERVTCETRELALTTFTGVARLTDLPCLDHSTPGPEASLRYVAETSGMVTVTISDASGELDLVVTDAMAGHCELATCRPASSDGTTQSVTFAATAGQIYFIVVDGPVGVGAPFTLTLDCT